MKILGFNHQTKGFDLQLSEETAGFILDVAGDMNCLVSMLGRGYNVDEDDRHLVMKCFYAAHDVLDSTRNNKIGRVPLIKFLACCDLLHLYANKDGLEIRYSGNVPPVTSKDDPQKIQKAKELSETMLKAYCTLAKYVEPRRSQKMSLADYIASLRPAANHI